MLNTTRNNIFLIHMAFFIFVIHLVTLNMQGTCCGIGHSMKVFFVANGICCFSASYIIVHAAHVKQ